METLKTGSFKDPSGMVFFHEEGVFRSVFREGAEQFNALVSANILEPLVQSGDLLPFEMVPGPPPFVAPEGTVTLLRHPRLPFISYPWEWPFSILKQAALLHLDLMDQLVPKGFWMRDASAFNTQYDQGRLRLIDLLSIGPRPLQRPWVAYRQFCGHFLAPLALAASSDVRLLGLWRNSIDGFPLDLATNVLPLRKLFSPGLFLHLYLHSRFQKSAEDKDSLSGQKRKKEPLLTDRGLLALVSSLRRVVLKQRWKPPGTIWRDYKEICSYEEEHVSQKADYVKDVIRRLVPQMVWDLGANTGEFSLLAAEQGARFVVAIDGDTSCTELIWKRAASEAQGRSVLPLTMDLANPSPPLGWGAEERMSLAQRGPADLVMALALVHHLVLTACIPLPMVAEWLGRISRHLLIEFVPPDDPMVKKLIQNRRGEHLPYHWDVFEAAFAKFFALEHDQILGNGRRLCLYRNTSSSGR